MQRIGGSRRKSRYKFRKEVRNKGKISVSRFMQRFDPGQTVYLTVESAYQKGMYHTRFMGKTGIIKSAQGRCYKVIINDHGKDKLLIVHPVHLKGEK